MFARIPSKETLAKSERSTPVPPVSVHVPLSFPSVIKSLKFKTGSFPLLLLLQMLSEAIREAMKGSSTVTVTSVKSSGQGLLLMTAYLKE